MRCSRAAASLRISPHANFLRITTSARKTTIVQIVRATFTLNSGLPPSASAAPCAASVAGPTRSASMARVTAQATPVMPVELSFFVMILSIGYFSRACRDGGGRNRPPLLRRHREARRRLDEEHDHETEERG